MPKVQNITRVASRRALEKLLSKTNEAPRIQNGETLMHSLSAMASVNRAKLTKKFEGFEIGLSKEELIKRTSKESFIEKRFLEVNSPEYLNLETGDKQALVHLVKASKILDEVFLKQDNALNIPFRKFLQKNANTSEDAQMALKMFKGQKGIIANDTEAHSVILKKGEKLNPGMGFYPADLSVEEFQSIIKKMLLDGKTDEVKAIVNQHSIVKKHGNDLKAVDYTQAYKKEYLKVAEELEKAAKVSTNADFNEYLMLQAAALRKNNPMLDAVADKKWATLQDTPLEFTMSRETYADLMTGSISENNEMMQMLNKIGITPYKKDSIGSRVGIVHKQGTEELLSIKPYLKAMAKNMPFCDEYEQNISIDAAKAVKQTMVDVNLVYESGQICMYRGGLTIASNLPNNDKLTFTIDGGRRNVFHREVRSIYNEAAIRKKVEAILDPKIQQNYSHRMLQEFTIAHENGHSLGPKTKDPKLGRKNYNIIEENKADMAALSSLDVLVKEGRYTELEKKQFITTFIANVFKKAPPDPTVAHRVREVMQLKYFLEKGAIKVDENGLVDINYDKVVPTARNMLEEIVRVQMKNDFETGEAFVNKYFVWTPEIERVSKNIRGVDNVLNGYITTPLADKLLQGQI